VKRLRGIALAAIGVYLLLAVPAPAPELPPAPDRGITFAWNHDAYWTELEQQFVAVRGRGCAAASEGAAIRITGLRHQLARLEGGTLDPESEALDSLETAYFEAAPWVAACPDSLGAYVALQASLRAVVKNQSRGWDVRQAPARERLYRMLYGSRAAVEEVILHHPGTVPALLAGTEASSATPAAMVAGVRVHSGDILVSRGGYPTSALIARGSDLPGNFSHVALVHVDAADGSATAVEAHIEQGVAIATAEQYLADKKLRIMLLRPRADLPALVADPLLPHRAASAALERARREHIPYDFAMDYTEDTRLFCSEVASAVYRQAGVTLWTGLSTISAPGLRRWLAAFGVRHFETQEPSDLEYDPQLVVVAEWRDPQALQADHVDNAVIDAMLEGAEAGDELTFPWYQLPLVRLAKGWSLVRERFGAIGPVPQGMSAAAALRNRAFGERQRRIAAEVHDRIAVLERDQGYPLPFWAILDLARQATARHPPA
jgi:hypothetical protein